MFLDAALPPPSAAAASLTAPAFGGVRRIGRPRGSSCVGCLSGAWASVKIRAGDKITAENMVTLPELLREAVEAYDPVWTSAGPISTGGASAGQSGTRMGEAWKGRRQAWSRRTP